MAVLSNDGKIQDTELVGSTSLKAIGKSMIHSMCRPVLTRNSTCMVQQVAAQSTDHFKVSAAVVCAA